ncbi:MAG: cytoplasmic protein [Pseudomonadota bacterium]
MRIFVHFFAAFLALTAFYVTVLAQEKGRVKTQQFILPMEGQAAPGEGMGDPAEDSIPIDALPSLKPIDPSDPNASVEEDDAEQLARERARPVPEILRDIDALPAPVRIMRAKLLELARTGDVEKLRSLMGSGDKATRLSIGETEGDPIAYLKEQSGDQEGFEILGILVDVLEAGYVHINDGEDEEIYVWPYFFAVPLDKLTPPQKVELFTVLTAGDVEESQEMGSYVFYRVGITPDGRWDFFVSGS